MTYTRAANNPENRREKRRLKRVKELADGIEQRWCMLMDGCIAVLIQSNADAVLVAIPVRSLKSTYWCEYRRITHDEWKHGLCILRDYENKEF